MKSSNDNETIKSRDVDPQPKKKSKALKIFTRIGITIIVLLVITASTLAVLLVRGRNEVLNGNQNVKIEVPDSFKTEQTDDNNDGSSENVGDIVFYNGKRYKYNDKITTIVFAGIDKRTEEHQQGVYGTAGQADCIFVMALDTESGGYKLMAVSRDSMVDVNIIDNKGVFQGTSNVQINLSYGYGYTKEQSAENLKNAVSRLFFGVPVNKYVAFDLDVIPILNDQVGGVNVTVNEDLTRRDPELYVGNNLTLNGTQAEYFVRTRDVTGDENQNNLRMERQKIYLTSFIKTTLKQTKSNIKKPLQMYNSCIDYMNTDITPSAVTYYTSVFLKSGFDADKNMIKVPGTTIAKDGFAEYHVDTDEFFKIILETYYKEV